MGYSATAAAFETMERIKHLCTDPQCGSNSLPNGGFWETGTEQPDGSMVGEVFAPVKGSDNVRLAGHFHIAPTGKVLKFPTLTPEQITQIETPAGLSRVGPPADRAALPRRTTRLR